MEFSANPLWPWCFGNCAVETGNSDLRRIVKGGPLPTHKIDPVHGLLDALYCFDLSEGRIES
jgi:phage terminase large subunit-like protein